MLGKPSERSSVTPAPDPTRLLLLCLQVVWFANAVVYYGLVLLVTTVSPALAFETTHCQRLQLASVLLEGRQHILTFHLPDHDGMNTGSQQMHMLSSVHSACSCTREAAASRRACQMARRT